MVATVKTQFMYLSLHLVLFYMNGRNIRGSRDCNAAVQFSSGHDDIHELSRVYQAGNVKFEPRDKDLLCFSPPSPRFQKPPSYLSLHLQRFYILHIHEITQYWSFSVSTPTRLSHVVKSDRFPLDDRLIVYCVYNMAFLSVHLTMGTEGCSRVFTPVNTAAMYLGVQAFL